MRETFTPRNGSEDRRLAHLEAWASARDALIEERWDAQFRRNQDHEKRLRGLEQTITENRMKIVLFSAVGSVIGTGVVGLLLAALVQHLIGGP